MTTLEERAAAMQKAYLRAKQEESMRQSQQQTMEAADDVSFADESKLTFNADEGYSSLAENDDDDDDAEGEAIQLIQTQLKEIGALKLELAKKE